MQPTTLPLPNGLTLHLDTADRLNDARVIAREIFEQGNYRRPGFELRPTDTVVDVGAHAGLFSLWAAPQVTHGTILAIEPTSAIDCLTRSLRQNDISHVRPLRCAVGTPGTTLEIIDCPAIGGLNRHNGFHLPPLTRFILRLCGQRRFSSRVLQTSARSLEDILHTEQVPRIDFLKIDCEGGEYTILEHASDALLGRIDRIAVEIHRFHPTHDPRRLVRRLRSSGFQVELHRPWFAWHFHHVGMLWARRSA